jgi:hypothetical protein
LRAIIQLRALIRARINEERRSVADVEQTTLRVHGGPCALELGPDRAMFVLVSFEGPDRYSQAGGLGVRVSGLADTLASLGYETRLFFIGDPNAPGEERAHDGHLILQRWAQWISANCPGGVYDGEAAKVADLTASLPPYLVERVLAPAIMASRTPILIFEEWQTAETACRVSDLLTALRIRDRAVVSWNANNCYGFERIDWARLAAATTITTISRYMRSIIRSCGADARVIPNGIPESALQGTTFPASARPRSRGPTWVSCSRWPAGNARRVGPRPSMPFGRHGWRERRLHPPARDDRF